MCTTLYKCQIKLYIFCMEKHNLKKGHQQLAVQPRCLFHKAALLSHLQVRLVPKIVR